ncbi:MAG: carboxypeptidase regulatory-like domain-containing protein [Polyangiaceae bacterium]|nr:carboxypeptidase regulatory-like domain-containing protein [Polyangiaceae bacterium]
MSLTRRFLLSHLLPVFALSLAACSIPFREAGDRQVNTCGGADECGPDAVCAPVNGDPVCASTKADLAGIIFEIQPSVVASFGAGTSYLIDPSAQGVALQSSIPGPVTWDPVLPPFVSVSPGEVNCLADMSSIPAKVELTRISAFAGLTEEIKTASSEMGEGSSYAFHADVLPGLYNIYVEPQSTPENPILCGGAPLPPVFIAGKEVAVNSTFRLDVETPRNLTGTIAAPDGVDLDGWTLRVIEMNSGRLISDVQTIAHENPPEPAAINLHYNLTSGVSPVLYLAPPAGQVAPSVFWDIAAIDLQGDNIVELALSTLALTPRDVEGHVLDANASPVIATVTLQSTGLSGDTFNNAAFKVDVETDADGLFKAKVPPGTYRVLAKPLEDQSLAVSEATWVIPDDATSCFCGQVVSVLPKVTLAGEVLTPTQMPLLQASVVASPSLLPPISYLDRKLGRAPEPPREATGFVEERYLSMSVDPGAFDFSIRPPAGSRYPWLVRSKLTVQPAEAFSSVGTLSIAHPVVVTGVVSDPMGDVVAGASIRAWLPVKNEEGISRTVIQIGDAVTDESGRYTIYLPPSISQ